MMRKHMLQAISIAAVILMLSMSAADAQNRVAIVGKIPFSFQAGESTLPAGKYMVRSATSSASFIVTIRNMEGRDVLMVLTHPTDVGNRGTQPKLVFSKYGSEYFLSRILSPADGVGEELLKGKREKELSANAGKFSTIEVAMARR